MKKIGIFFGTIGGTTHKIAQMIQKELGEDVPVKNISETMPEELASYDSLIFGVATYEHGLFDENWDEFYPKLDTIDFSGKKVAVFGLGSQAEYPDTFVGGMGKVARKVRERGGELVGKWPITGYQFESSDAKEGDMFLGLAIDELIQADLTEERVKKWAAEIKGEMGI